MYKFTRSLTILGSVLALPGTAVKLGCRFTTSYRDDRQGRQLLPEQRTGVESGFWLRYIKTSTRQNS